MEEGYLQRFKIKLPKADKRIKETYTDEFQRRRRKFDLYVPHF